MSGTVQSFGKVNIESPDRDGRTGTWSLSPALELR